MVGFPQERNLMLVDSALCKTMFVHAMESQNCLLAVRLSTFESFLLLRSLLRPCFTAFILHSIRRLQNTLIISLLKVKYCAAKY